MKPLVVTIPHSGEQIPPEARWLDGLSETILMCDVDRYVDQLYLETLGELKLSPVICPWHRYVVDLNRLSEDVDQDSVLGHSHRSGSFPQGLHWVNTTKGYRLMKEPISPELHDLIVQKYFEPFHQQVRDRFAGMRAEGFTQIYHLDLHSMPSTGTGAHRDAGQRRAEIVISDFNGKSASREFLELVKGKFVDAGFQIAVNWPYIGGRLTQTYGQPEHGQHTIQVELRRDLYMNEESKQKNGEMQATKVKLAKALKGIYEELPIQRGR